MVGDRGQVGLNDEIECGRPAAPAWASPPRQCLDFRRIEHAAARTGLSAGAENSTAHVGVDGVELYPEPGGNFLCGEP
jgi:hypothetical protein